MNDDVLVLLAQLERGALAADLSEAVTDVVKAVTALGKAGTVTLKLTIAPTDTQHVTDALTIQAEIVPKPPVPPRRASIVFTDDDGRLGRNPSKDPEMFPDGDVADRLEDRQTKE